MFGWKKETAPRRMAETSAAADGGFVATRGLIAGTRIGTAMGWRPVEALAAGDMVLTFDNGLQPLVDVRREVYWLSDRLPERDALVVVPAGAMGNTVDVAVPSDQGVLIESEAACDAQGDPFAVVRAKHLDGFRGVHRAMPPVQMEVVTLVFANEEVIYAEGGILLHCARMVMHLDDLVRAASGYEVLSAHDASFLVDCMAVEYAGGMTAASPMVA